MDLLKYMRIPYRLNGRGRDGVDCYGLIMLVYAEELGIKLFDPGNIDDWRRLSNTDELERGAQLEWVRVTEPRPFDVVLLRRFSKTPNHCGLVIDSGCFLEATELSGIHVSKTHMWARDIHAYYRYRGLNDADQIR